MIISNYLLTISNCDQRWLAEDFQKERLRHRTNAKKQSKLVEAFVSSKELRKLKKNKVCMYHLPF